MIYHFSGTGNSLHVARELARLLECQALPMRREMEVGPGEAVFVFPIYCWGVPPYVLQCLATARVQGRPKAYMVATCGDDAGLADKTFRRAATRAGFSCQGAATVEMPNNYVCMKGFDTDPAEVEQRKLAQCDRKVQAVADWIGHRGFPPPYTRGRWAWVKSRIINPWFVRRQMTPVRFNVGDACVGCGECSRQCPLGNITMQAAGQPRPTWGTDCAFCLGCYHRCPRHAIDWGGQTKNKGQYTYHET